MSAVGIITADSPKDFDEFARGRQLSGATIVLDSSGGSVNDAITLGRRFRGLGAHEEVGFTADELKATEEFLHWRTTTIYGGSSEVQANIIAKRVLGLPD